MPERSRPQIHFTAANGWINDPLGLTWHDGAYHLFFQHVPGSTEWAVGCHWGHAVSPDLAHWEEQPVALAPDADEDGVWSGSLVVDDDGRATVLYTAVHEPDLDQGEVRLARPLDGSWTEWRKGGTVLRAPESPATTIFRDPFVYRDGDRWRMLVGGAVEGDLAVAFSYTSPDLTTWTPDGVAAERSGSLQEPVWSGVGWECPQLIEVDGARVLIVSAWAPGAIHHVAAAVGDWADGRFTAEGWQQLTLGPGYYAPSVFRDRDGRPAIVFWIRDAGAPQQGWQGAISVPHLLAVEDGRVVTRPHPDAVAAAALVEAGAAAEVVTAGPTLVESPASIASDLRITEEPWADVRVRAAGGDLVVEVGGAERVRFPRDGDALRVLVDGPAVELWQGATLFACGR